MVEHRPWLTFLTHATLLLGMVIIVFPELPAVDPMNNVRMLASLRIVVCSHSDLCPGPIRAKQPTPAGRG
jgi:hypothetical protein